MEIVIIGSFVMSGTGRVKFNHGDINSGSAGAVPGNVVGKILYARYNETFT